jgi:hypothetical protein
VATLNPDGAPVVPVHPTDKPAPTPPAAPEVQAAIDAAISALWDDIIAPESPVLTWTEP